MTKQYSHHITRIVMFLIGLLFSLFIVALIYNTIVFCVQNYCRLGLHIPVRLFLLIFFYYVAGLCGCLPFHNRLRPNILPQPFLVWKCTNRCTCIRDQWHRLRYRLLGYEGFYNISLNDEIRQYFEDQIENLRTITNSQESQANDTTDSPYGVSYRLYDKSAPIKIPKVKGRSGKLQRRENDRTHFKTRPSHSHPRGPLHLEKSGQLPNYVGVNIPESEGSALPSSKSDDIFLFESDKTERNENEYPNERLASSSHQCNIIKYDTELQTGKRCEIRAGKFRDVPDAEQDINIPSDEAYVPEVVVVVKQYTSTDPSPFNESHERVHSEELHTLERSMMNKSDEESIFSSCPESESVSEERVFTKEQCSINNESVSCENQLVNISDEARQLSERDSSSHSEREEIYSLLEKGESKRIDTIKDDTDLLHTITIRRFQGKPTERQCDDIRPSNTRENVNSEEPSSIGISQSVPLSEERQETDASPTDNRTKHLNVSSYSLSDSSKKPKGSRVLAAQKINKTEI